MKKLFAFDMDGTILLDDHITINPFTVDAIKEAKKNGHSTAISTGRSLQMILPILKKTPNGNEMFDYIIGNNGSFVYNTKTKEVILNGLVDTKHVLEMVKISKNTSSSFAVHFGDGEFARINHMVEGTELHKRLFFDETKLSNFYTEESEVVKMIESKDVVQASIRNDSHVIYETYETVKNFENSAVHIVGEEFLDINPHGIDKFIGVDLVGKKLGIPIENYICFGDSGNDLAMLQGCGIGVAMGNGTKEAKEIANETIGDNNSKAILKFIERHI